MTAYARVSPFWLRALLWASGLLLVSRYILGANPKSSEALWTASSIGLTLPGVVAIDQLIRHPAMTPKKLLRWYALFLVVDGALCALTGIAGHVVAMIGLCIGIIGFCVLFIRKIPSLSIQKPLLVLAVSYGSLGLSLPSIWWSTTAWLYAEMATLFALWYAYDTSAWQQATG